MFSRQIFRDADLKDPRTWFNPVVVLVVLSLTAYLANRVSRMNVVNSRLQLELVVIGLGLAAFFLYTLNHMNFGLYVLFFSSVTLNLGIETGTRAR